MLSKSRKKIKVIQTQDPAEFERLYNEAIEQLDEEEYTAEVQPYAGAHCAYIFYKEVEQIFNLVSDEFHAEGVRFLCGQCPYHDPVDDGRKKRVYCKYADCGMTDIRRECCEMFYAEVKAGKVKPIY